MGPVFLKGTSISPWAHYFLLQPKSKWLNGDELIRTDIIDRIASIEIFHDFDEHDNNITTLLKINRDFNGHYFAVQSETGIPQLNILLKRNYAYTKLASDDKISNYIFRISGNFQLNAFFDPGMKTVTVFAPFIHKSSFHSNILKEPFITYFFLGHELYHSLFSKSTPALLDLYSHRRTCISNHYEDSCKKFGMGSCKSGPHTITEDAPDLESYRTLYSLLQDRYSKKQLKTKIKGLKTTLEQEFFYYVASGWCAKDVKEEEGDEDEHSANNIRVNTPFSLMSEFTKAFGCKKGDVHVHVQEKDSCYVFGPKSQFAL